MPVYLGMGKLSYEFSRDSLNGQDNVALLKRKNKTINPTLYRDEMYPLMFRDISNVMDAEEWI